MASCHEMKVGQVYACEGCGLELKVVKECGSPAEECECPEPCTFECCDEPPKLKT